MRFVSIRFAKIALTAILVFSLGLIVRATLAMNSAEDEYSLLRDAIDLHLHIDPERPDALRPPDSIEISGMKYAQAQGMRGFVIKNHYETTASVAYLIRKEIPGIEAFGGITLNHNQGGINLAVVEYMATRIKGNPLRVVWMPTYDAENWIRNTDIPTDQNPDRPFVKVVRNGELLPEVKQMIGVIAKHNLVLATGHLSPEEILLVVKEGRRQNVQHMIVTHPMIAAISMNETQMREAADLGAFLEFDYRVLLAEPHETDMIRAIGPEYVVIDEFWTASENGQRDYGNPDGLTKWVKEMNSRGFSNDELDMMVKDNPAKLLGLSAP